ncbi:hypothetical protein HYALB_00004016 [Hymenoscyphus albidus]|uniref:Rhodopsin domain-containing protein n=1 Tax=Hymenoscyphus albidus TaxID=595503 RepID=A0A9N9QCI3_9HELO|nr:hypothetical protein HYALB_00004016 [Hymenoscyphus albidus]
MAMDLPKSSIPGNKHPSDIVCKLNAVVGILSVVLIVPVVVMRIWVRRNLQGGMHLEDWVCISATFFFIAYCANTTTLSNDGGGMHIWDVSNTQYRRFLFGMWRNTLLYGPAALLIKITLLLIFTRIWAPIRIAVISINIFMVLLLIYYITMLVIKVMICEPIHAFWDLNVRAHCWDINGIFLADAIVSVTTDIAILVIPIPLIWDLHVSLVKKIKLFGILGAGGLAAAASVARLRKVTTMFTDPDKTLTLVEFSMLGILELFLGILCASFPALNALIMRLLGRRDSKETLESNMKGSQRSDEEKQSNSGSSANLEKTKSVAVVEDMHGKEDRNAISPPRGRPPMVGAASCDYLLGGIPQKQ